MCSLINRKKEILEKFQCDQCGLCCERGGLVYITDSEINSIADFLGLSTMKFRQQYVRKENGWNILSSQDFNQDCFFKNGICSIYAGRPRQCKTYPNWPEIWESETDLKLEALQCKGLGKALL
jgi:uncharacterized protein